MKTREYHGLHKHPLYKVYDAMKQRCFNKNNKQYKDYGGRGITVCPEWINGFQNFFDWAMRNGYKKGLHLDREKNDLDYSPQNCRFVTQAENNRNQNKTIHVIYNGETKCLSQWERIFNLGKGVLRHRLNAGWPLQKALETPTRGRHE